MVLGNIFCPWRSLQPFLKLSTSATLYQTFVSSSSIHRLMYPNPNMRCLEWCREEFSFPKLFNRKIHVQLGHTGFFLMHVNFSIVQMRHSSNTKSAPSKYDNAPLRNEHLITKLLARRTSKKGASDGIDEVRTQRLSGETYQVRLIIEESDTKKPKAPTSDEDTQGDKNHTKIDSSPKYASQIVTLKEAVNIANRLNFDLMEISLQQNPPVIKALDFERWLYHQKKESKSNRGDAISDKPLKEFKFRAEIAEHDLQRKTSNMIEYLSKGHAVRVTLTARQRSLLTDAQAIKTTMDRIRNLVGDKAVEARGMRSNDRGSIGDLLLHPNVKK